MLAIDTSQGTSLALLDPLTGRAWSAEEPGRLRHAEVIGDLIARVLEDAGVRPSDVGLVAVGTGPGTFTGLRIGIAAGRAFAFGRGVPIVGVSSHDAIALAMGGRGTVVTDAKRREAYATPYSGLDGHGLPAPSGPTEIVPVPEGGFSAAPRAADVARIAAIRARDGLEQRPPAPDYLRSPDISRAKPKRVTG